MDFFNSYKLILPYLTKFAKWTMEIIDFSASNHLEISLLLRIARSSILDWKIFKLTQIDDQRASTELNQLEHKGKIVPPSSVRDSLSVDENTVGERV